MHVIYLHQHFSTTTGSAGTRSYEMAKALLLAGHTVTMVCGSYQQGKTGLAGPFYKGARRGVVDGINVIEFDLRYGNHMGFIKRLLVFLKFALGSISLVLREPADIVFATSTPLTAAIPGVFSKLIRRRPFVLEVRDLWPELPKAMGVIKNPLVLYMMSVLEWIAYKSADRLIGLSPGIVEGIAARGIDKSSIRMIPNGCDLDLFGHPSKPWRPSGVRDEELLAIFAGTHGYANGLDAVLDAANELRIRGRDDIKIVLIGEGSEKSRLQTRAIDEKLTNVIFLYPIPKTDLSNLLAGADIGLQILRNVPAFYFGTSPNKFFDYISARLPVICNYPGWLSCMIQEQNCGFVLPPDDPQMFADILIEAADNRSALREKAINSRILAETFFSRKNLSSNWVKWVTIG